MKYGIEDPYSKTSQRLKEFNNKMETKMNRAAKTTTKTAAAAGGTTAYVRTLRFMTFLHATTYIDPFFPYLRTFIAIC